MLCATAMSHLPLMSQSQEDLDEECGCLPLETVCYACDLLPHSRSRGRGKEGEWEGGGGGGGGRRESGKEEEEGGGEGGRVGRRRRRGRGKEEEGEMEGEEGYHDSSPCTCNFFRNETSCILMFRL